MSKSSSLSITQLNLMVIEALRGFLDKVISDGELRKLVTGSENNFTRSRKLPLHLLVGFILNLVKRSLSVEIHDFFDSLGKGSLTCTKSAFCQHRAKLLPLFFQMWNQVLVDNFYKNYGKHIKRWKAFRLQAVDGSTAYLLDNEKVKAHFGTQDNQFGGFAMGRVMQIFDVLNHLIVWGDISGIKESEQSVMAEMVSKLSEDSLTLFDRGYPSFALMYLLINKPIPSSFLMRCTLGFNNIVSDFVKSGKSSKIVEFAATESAIEFLLKMGIVITKKTTIKIRMVKFKLPSGITEVLLTNLYDEKLYTLGNMKHLYGLRWGIETNYYIQKNQQQMEQLSGHRIICIQQDYLAGLLTANLQSLIEKQSDKYLKQINEKRKLDYKINRNVSWGVMKNQIVQLFIAKKPKEILVKLQNEFERNIEAVRPDRSYPRKKKTKRLNGKYQTLTNYRRAV